MKILTMAAEDKGVAQTSSLLYRGFPIRSPHKLLTACRLEVGDTAGWKPALLALGRLRSSVVSALCGILLAVGAFSASAAEPGEEQRLIEVLQSNASLQQKDAACARLKRIGTAQSIPALVALLGDENLGHTARYALESMPWPETGPALLAALEKTSGSNRVGLITVLGNRHETAAIGKLKDLLKNADSATGIAAAHALGRLAGAEAASALKSALTGASTALREAILDAQLACAVQANLDGDKAGAFAVFSDIYAQGGKDKFKLAAYEGMIRSGWQGLGLVLEGIRGNDASAQLAALQMARDFKGDAAGKALAELLPGAKPAVQMALIECLAQRGESSVAPQVAEQVKSADVAVRIAALNALGILGDASVVPVLAEKLVATDANEQKAAELAVLRLKGNGVTEALLGQVTSAKPAVQLALVKLLPQRGEKTIVPKLLELARTGSGAAQKAGLMALAQLADAAQVPALVQLVVEARSEETRDGAQEVLAAVYQRAQGKIDVGPIVQGLAKGNADAKAALLQACSLLADPQIRAALRASVKDADAKVRAAGIRALCNSRDPELTKDLLELARSAQEANVRAQAIRGHVRMVTEEESNKLPGKESAAMLKQILDVANSQQEKWVVLAGLARVTAPEALELALPMTEQTGLQAEACQAATQIAANLRGSQPELARTALKKVMAVAPDDARKQAARTILSQMDAMADFITGWQVAGPYEQNGKSYDALFDVVFAPENPEAKGVNWKVLPPSTDPKQPWLMDLLKAIGGEQRVAYARTRIYCDKEQPARLELGSDDGVKVWLNGKVVHANNTARATTVGSDKVKVTLKQGWNDLLLKVTQNNMGWEFCARIVNPDGTRVEGMRWELPQ